MECFTQIKLFKIFWKMLRLRYFAGSFDLRGLSSCSFYLVANSFCLTCPFIFMNLTPVLFFSFLSKVFSTPIQASFMFLTFKPVYCIEVCSATIRRVLCFRDVVRIFLLQWSFRTLPNT